ncbi:unnamed protein product (macronuclear) [Paramecium tetraurelia]|uniref:Kinesin-like protein n=1 Tax=Paramecium tetraurelia TaxID=5888 RepID=A0BNJ9_PARTE|nr:uncharacterized protein GSPATT00030754001 [Paramecium tetraurelia]CAK60116.1 unnamed protein product [Paramecium tetraurelia]|eukprot:XP_001427514.1 hypothetical protein (macronuclear) [Paramecium tetraurelia strain d4-2]
MNQFEKETKQFIDELKNGVSNILVAIRVRPLSQKERSQSEFETIRILDNKMIVLLDPDSEREDDLLKKNRLKETNFAFDFVFDQWAPQQMIYENTTEFLLEGVLEGYNTTVFCYGATGSGKTFTQMIGTHQEVGIMPRALQQLFNFSIQDRFKDTQFKVCYVEIYNENIRDLLTHEDKNLEIREDKNSGIQIAGVTEVEVRTVSEVLALLKVGNKNRSKEATDANKESSRSHAILQLQIESKERATGIQEQIIQSKFSLVDLAGSERAANTNNKGQRMIEGANINKSLLVLGNCIQSLSEANEKGIKNPFIPFRNSKLTRLLKDSLGGNCRTVMISNVTPAVNCFEETYNTLVYANRAKNIKTIANRNVLMAQNHISNYAQLIQNLRQENEELKLLIQQQQYNQNNPQLKLPSIIQKNPPSVQQSLKQQVSELESIIHQNVEDIIQTKNQIYEMEEQQNHFQQNIGFLQFQKGRTQDKFEQMRLQERMDNAKNQKAILKRSQDDLEQQLVEYEVQKVDIQKQVQQIQDSNYKNYLYGIMKQGEFKIETIEIKIQEKKRKYQEQIQDEQVKQLRTQINKQQAKITQGIKQKSNVLKKVPSLPGVDSPYYQLQNGQTYGIQRYQKNKSHLKLPPVVQLAQVHKSPKTQNTSLQNKIDDPMKYRISQKYSSRLNRPPSYHPPSSQRKSAKGRYINRSLDLGSGRESINKSSGEIQNEISLQKLHRLRKEYQQQRFEKAMNNKNNQKSQPQFGSKILLPGMIHKSPYVKNFQNNNEPIELKKDRLKMFNLNQKIQGDDKFQLYN